MSICIYQAQYIVIITSTGTETQVAGDQIVTVKPDWEPGVKKMINGEGNVKTKKKKIHIVMFMFWDVFEPHRFSCEILRRFQGFLQETG